MNIRSSWMSLKLIHLDLVPTLNDGIGPHWPCQPDRYCLVREGLSKHITCVFICCFIYPCQNDILNFWPKGGFFYLKPRTALKVRENRDPQMLRNHKPHLKPHLKGTKNVNRTSNRNPKSLKPQPATHWAPSPLPSAKKEDRDITIDNCREPSNRNQVSMLHACLQLFVPRLDNNTCLVSFSLFIVFHSV